MEFKLDELLTLYSKCTYPKIGNDMVPDLTQCQEYINKTFFTIKSGMYAVIEGNDLVFHDKDTAKTLYINRFPPPVKKWFMTGQVPLYRTDVIERTNERVNGDKINVYEPIKSQRKAYETFPNKVKDKCHRMLNHIRNIWCSKNKDQYDYILQIFKSMFEGRKNHSIIYLRGAQGIGKSMVVDFLVEHVIGQKASCKGTSTQLKTSYNMAMLGKRLIRFEELPTFTTSEWMAVSSTLKAM